MIDNSQEYNGIIHLDGSKSGLKCKVRFNNDRELDVVGIGNRGISIYVFRRHMLSRYFPEVMPKRENYIFSGPRLGVYYEIRDPREGPCLNHWVESLNIEIAYETTGTTLLLKGVADYSISSMDEYYYPERKFGIWGFVLEFEIPKPQGA